MNQEWGGVAGFVPAPPGPGRNQSSGHSWTPLPLGGCLVGCTLPRTVLGLVLCGKNTAGGPWICFFSARKVKSSCFLWWTAWPEAIWEFSSETEPGWPWTHKRFACLVSTAIESGVCEPEWHSWSRTCGLWFAMTKETVPLTWKLWHTGQWVCWGWKSCGQPASLRRNLCVSLGQRSSSWMAATQTVV